MMSKQFCSLGLLVLLTAVIGCGGGDESAGSGEAINENLNTPLPGTDGATATVSGNGRSTGNDANAIPFGNQPSSEGSSSNTSPVATSKSTRNGLFPNFPETASGSSGFGGALFPRMSGGSSSTTASSGRGSSRDNSGFASSGSADRDDDPFDLGDDFHEDGGNSSDSFASTSAAEPDISLLLDAKRLFEKHDEQAAVAYLYANHLVSDEARKSYNLNWYSGLKEPRLFFRWGVGVIFNKPRDFDGRHPVIGDPGDENEGVSQSSSGAGGGRNFNGGLGAPTGRSGGGGRTGGGSRVYKNVDTGRPDGFLLYYTGDFGEKLISYLDSRRTDEDTPYYGQILKDVMEAKEPEEEQQIAQSNSRRPGINRGGGNGLATGTGNVGVFGDNNAGRSRPGRGNSNSQPLQRTDTSVIDRASGRSIASKPDDDFMGTIIPGVELLGRGSKTELLERAKEANVDTLVIFNVKISKSRGSRNRSASSAPTSTNITSMKIVDVKTGENLFSSKSLKDTSVSEDNDDGEDPVKDQIEKAFATLADEKYKAMEMPKSINETNVKKRIGAVLKSKTAPLRSAVEVISFYESGLLPEKLAITAMTRLFDSADSAVLVTGTQSQRLNFLREWLPEGPGE